MSSTLGITVVGICNFCPKIVITSVSLKFEPHIKAYLSISLDSSIVLAPSKPHFKGFSMRNLQYEIRICQKSHNTVTITVYVWTVVRILMKQTLYKKQTHGFETFLCQVRIMKSCEKQSKRKDCPSNFSCYLLVSLVIGP